MAAEHIKENMKLTIFIDKSFALICIYNFEASLSRGALQIMKLFIS